MRLPLTLVSEWQHIKASKSCSEGRPVLVLLNILSYLLFSSYLVFVDISGARVEKSVCNLEKVNFFFLSIYTGLAPRISRPSSVRVPVLSKHIILILPVSLIVLGEIQKICFFWSLANATLMPTYTHVGKAGGTVIVII